MTVYVAYAAITAAWAALVGALMDAEKPRAALFVTVAYVIAAVSLPSAFRSTNRDPDVRDASPAGVHRPGDSFPC